MEILSTVRECMARAVEAAEAKEHQQQQEQGGRTTTAAAVAGEERGGAPGNVASRVKAVGLTNQRETTVVWRRSTGEPLHNAIVWMDTRTSPICRSVCTPPNSSAKPKSLYPVNSPTSCARLDGENCCVPDGLLPPSQAGEDSRRGNPVAVMPAGRSTALSSSSAPLHSVSGRFLTPVMPSPCRPCDPKCHSSFHCYPDTLRPRPGAWSSSWRAAGTTSRPRRASPSAPTSAP